MVLWLWAGEQKSISIKVNPDKKTTIFGLFILFHLGNMSKVWHKDYRRATVSRWK
jgi:hypothetical protein